MDKELKMQLIDVMYSVVICAIPNRKDPDVADIRIGYGGMCPWNERQRLEAYKAIKKGAEKVIKEIEKGI
jgi:hypothetical protein